jgi:hypothetical protein
MTKRKFYRTIVTVEILSDEPIDNPDLEMIARQIDSGDWVGNTEIQSQKVLSGRRTVKILNKLGS